MPSRVESVLKLEMVVGTWAVLSLPMDKLSTERELKSLSCLSSFPHIMKMCVRRRGGRKGVEGERGRGRLNIKSEERNFLDLKLAFLH